ncbi:MAG: polyhydroxyalkanoic acid system family protein [Patescibacteria group bacterium]|nr:polyhydroxyalkanoic acid system family protein [Patescibacteria group bacterium]
MELKVPHKFSKDEAVARVKKMLDDARTKLADKATIEEERWEGDTLHFACAIEGQGISGSVAVSDAQYDITLKLPLMMRVFEGRIKKMIEEQSKQMLS